MNINEYKFNCSRKAAWQQKAAEYSSKEQEPSSNNSDL